MSEGPESAPLAGQLVHRLTVAIRVACLYGLDNVLVEQSAQELLECLTRVLERAGRATILVDRRLVYLNGRLLRGRAWLEDWNDLLERFGLGGVFLGGEWSAEHVRALLGGFVEASASKGPERAAQLTALGEQLLPPAALRLFDPEQAAIHAREEEEGHLPPRSLAAFYYARLLALAEALGRGPDIHARIARQTVVKLVDRLAGRPFEHQLLLLTASPVEADPLARHAANVTVLSLLVGRLLGLHRAELTDLGFAALYHDLGRLEGASEEPAAHVAQGVARCLRGRSAGAAARYRLIVAHEHHTVAPAAGAPEPHLFSRIVALADAYDRLEAEGRRSPAAALRALGEELPAPWVELLRDVHGPLPRGTLVRLPTGATGVVVEGGARRGGRPLVCEVLGADGEPVGAQGLSELAPEELTEEREPARAVDWRRALAGPLPLAGRLELLGSTGLSLEAMTVDVIGTVALGAAGQVAPRQPVDLERVRMLLSDDMSRAYVIGPRLGSGGQGTVYEVQVQGDTAFAGVAHPVEQAVIKVAHAEARAALEREREIYGFGLPGLVRLLDAGTTATEDPYLVLERLEPLPAQRFGRPRVDPATGVDVFVHLLDALRRIHFDREHALVLCDLKPDNVMLRLPGLAAPADESAYLERLRAGAYAPVLLDAGIAQDRRPLERRAGQVERIIGTPAFLPPESAPVVLSDRVVRGRYSQRTDVYSLTLSFYVLLTGVRPYAETGVYELQGQELLVAMFELKQRRRSPIQGERLRELFDARSASLLLEVLAAGLHPDPERRASLAALSRACARSFGVVEVDAPGAGLRRRQTLFPPPDAAAYGR